MLSWEQAPVVFPRTDRWTLFEFDPKYTSGPVRTLMRKVRAVVVSTWDDKTMSYSLMYRRSAMGRFEPVPESIRTMEEARNWLFTTISME